MSETYFITSLNNVTSNDLSEKMKAVNIAVPDSFVVAVPDLFDIRLNAPDINSVQGELEYILAVIATAINETFR